MPLLQQLFDYARELDSRDAVLLVGGSMEAGTNFNVVPDRCRFTIDRRTNPDEDFEAEKRALLDLIGRASQEAGNVKVRTIQEGRSALTSPDATARARAGRFDP